MNTSYYNVLAGFGAAGVAITFVISVLVIVAYFMSISMFTKVAQAKGHYLSGTGKLWFIGIFATPLILGIYVASLPDVNAGK